ncbi:MAG: hypothetical protein KF891_00280 [Rhizobacter sp.]|nr:hypothetical protein [Rhizobacter sp.]
MEIDLLGTRVDAARLFSLRFAGGLYLDADTRATLDTLLVALSAEPNEAEWAKFEGTLRRGLPHEDAEAALRLFQNYKAYLADVRAQAPELGIPANASAADAYFDRLAAIQRQHFDDATASALFEQETRQARAVMKAALVEQDESMSWEQKRDRLNDLRAQLPEADRGLIVDPPRSASEPR